MCLLESQSGRAPVSHCEWRQYTLRHLPAVSQLPPDHLPCALEKVPASFGDPQSGPEGSKKPPQ